MNTNVSKQTLGVRVYWKSLKKYTAIQAPPSPVLLFLLNFHQIQGFPNWSFFLAILHAWDRIPAQKSVSASSS